MRREFSPDAVGQKPPQLQPKPRAGMVFRWIGRPVITAVSAVARMLTLPAAATDITGMIDLVLDELADVAAWQELLVAYRDRQQSHVESTPEHEGWVPRIRSLQAVDTQQLSRLHGRLIALGLLRFELEGRTSGMSYQVTTLGHRALAGQVSDDGGDSACCYDATADRAA